MPKVDSNKTLRHFADDDQFQSCPCSWLHTHPHPSWGWKGERGPDPSLSHKKTHLWIVFPRLRRCDCGDVLVHLRTSESRESAGRVLTVEVDMLVSGSCMPEAGFSPFENILHRIACVPFYVCTMWKWVTGNVLASNYIHAAST